ncbi:MAG: hypothetical protein MUC48_03845 [Leptolyngbya sp. Prado105]|nr:hypothetical protein [Leptolyngbya sp. Prado105]
MPISLDENDSPAIDRRWRIYRAYRVPSVRDATQQGSAFTPVGLVSFVISPIQPDNLPRTFWSECVSLISLSTKITKLTAIRLR